MISCFSILATLIQTTQFDSEHIKILNWLSEKNGEFESPRIPDLGKKNRLIEYLKIEEYWITTPTRVCISQFKYILWVWDAYCTIAALSGLIQADDSIALISWNRPVILYHKTLSYLMLLLTLYFISFALINHCI